MDNRHNHPHDPLPEFIFVWTAKRYGLRDLVGTTRHDIAHAAQVYDDVPEVRTFLAFMLEDYDTEQLSFYLYARAVIHDRAATNDAEKALAAAFSHDSGTRVLRLRLFEKLLAHVAALRRSGGGDAVHPAVGGSRARERHLLRADLTQQPRGNPRLRRAGGRHLDAPSRRSGRPPFSTASFGWVPS